MGNVISQTLGSPRRWRGCPRRERQLRRRPRLAKAPERERNRQSRGLGVDARSPIPAEATAHRANRQGYQPPMLPFSFDAPLHLTDANIGANPRADWSMARSLQERGRKLCPPKAVSCFACLENACTSRNGNWARLIRTIRQRDQFDGAPPYLGATVPTRAWRESRQNGIQVDSDSPESRLEVARDCALENRRIARRWHEPQSRSSESMASTRPMQAAARTPSISARRASL